MKARLKKQKGFSTIQIVAGLGIAAALAGAAATVLLPAYNQAVLSSAYDEIHLVAGAVRQVRQYNGGYPAEFGADADTAVGFTWLVNNGYLQGAGYQTGTNENVYGENIRVGRVDDVTAAIRYTAGEDEQCLTLLDRVTTTLPGADGGFAATCAAELLTFRVN